MKKGWLTVCGLLLLGCGDDQQRVQDILTSEHFEVRVHPGAIAPPEMLEGLEEHYRTTAAFLGFPPVKVLYSLYASVEEVQDACGILPMEGLACAMGRQVFAADPWNEHELIHAYLWAVGDPPAIFAEGIAQGIRCGGDALPVDVDVPPWEVAVAQNARGNKAIYDAGFFLFVHLAETFGIARFIQFYAETGNTRDPAVFRQRFESFWGVSIDQIWQDMRLPRMGVTSTTIVPLRAALCPCTQSSVLSVEGVAKQLPSRRLVPLKEVQGVPADRVLPLPDGDPGPYLFSTTGSTFLRSCAQDREFDLRGYDIDSSQRAMLTVARLAPERHYVAVTGIGPATVAVTKGEFITPRCEEATPIGLTPDASGEVNIRIAADVAPASVADWFWRIAIPGPTAVTIRPPPNASTVLTVCPSCDSTGSGCMDIAASEGSVLLNVNAPELVFHASHPPDAYYLAVSAAVFSSPSPQ